MKKEIRFIIILSLFVISLLLRKVNFILPALIVLYTSILLIIISILRKKNINFFQKIIFLFYLIISFCYLQLWTTNRIFAIILLMTFLLFFKMNYHAIRFSASLVFFSTILLFLMSSSVLMNARKYYNFYRYNPYEDYLINKSSIYQGALLDFRINQFKNPEKERSDSFLADAFQYESKNENEKALTSFNRSIDLFPDNDSAYFRRGYLKLARLELNEDNALSAAKDFSRAIRLRNDFTEAYYQRMMAYNYIHLHYYSLADRHIVWNCDSILPDSSFSKKYGVSKEAFTVPFHPRLLLPKDTLDVPLVSDED